MTLSGHTSHGGFHAGSEPGKVQSKSCVKPIRDSKNLLENEMLGAWVTQWLKHLSLAQVMIPGS